MNTIIIRLDPSLEIPLYRQLYEHIKKEIISCSYGPGTKLPSKRRLASYLQCSQNTVQAAYGQLLAEGYITAKPKSGYYVCELEGVLHIAQEQKLKAHKSQHLRFYRYDFSHDGVDFDSFPFTRWRRITKEVINEYDRDLLKAGSPQGDRALRESIERYLRYSRGVKCTPEQIVISSGTEYLLQLLIQLLDEDYIFAIENPGYQKLNLLFKSNRAIYKSIPLDEEGMKIDELIQSESQVACVTPSHQFPTGTIMPVNRRIQLLNWAAEKKGRYIIEDDYDSEFKYVGKPIPSLQGLDKARKVIYIGSFSKSLSPSVRVSYMVLPHELIKKYYEKLSFYICPVPAVEQKTLKRFIDEGYFERHMNKMRNIYKAKRAALVEAITRLLPDAQIQGANAGLHLLLKVNNAMNEEELVHAARQRDVKVYGISRYYSAAVSDGLGPLIMLGFATLRAEEIEHAVEILKEAWRGHPLAAEALQQE